MRPDRASGQWVRLKAGEGRRWLQGGQSQSRGSLSAVCSFLSLECGVLSVEVNVIGRVCGGYYVEEISNVIEMVSLRMAFVYFEFDDAIHYCSFPLCHGDCDGCSRGDVLTVLICVMFDPRRCLRVVSYA